MPPEYRDEITVEQLLATLWRRKWLIISLAAAFAMVAVAASLGSKKKYEATVLLSPVTENSTSSRLSSLGSVASQLGSLAPLAGLSGLGNEGKNIAIATLQSEALTQRFIETQALLPILFSDQWDSSRSQWISVVKQPTPWKGNEYFSKRVRSVSENAKTGLVSLSITWTDPTLAAKWANEIVQMTNDYLRTKAIQESEADIAYLNAQIEKTNVIELRNAIYSLMENEIKKEMLARGSEEYALKVVDPAVAPERASSPRPTLWGVSAAMLGLCLGIFIALTTFDAAPAKEVETH